MSEDVASWLACWVNQYGHFPDDYLVIDTETTGLDRQDDVIVQLGYCRVENREVVENVAYVLDWTDHTLNQDWLCGRLESTGQRLREKGHTYSWTLEKLASEGKPPIDVLFDLLGRLREYGGKMLAAHNGVGFDVPMIEAHLKRFLALPFTFPKQLWDTGVMEKAIQLDVRPRPGEPLLVFCKRVLGIRAAGVKWSLDRHCTPKYQLDHKYGLDTSRSHTADYDAYVTSCLLEEFRQLAQAHQETP